ncbi:ABC transporter ATP-binding protein [Gloeobacter violaceus]|uniref:HlyB/MsbA family ABC transporter n=1 Tax=Gloeobacter violaceus (strain ATCC 29082 / PCC 7421) TaxID=251221 RepID=Q7NNT8_GLOVI|nr:ABC transporter ATP-binding protein [Gloeobacter violaceus]BAC88262.1 HlyB/MsbA family ABC transporter [Gloeobacter violaceus PCC 7421]
MLVDFGFDLAGRTDARLWRGLTLSILQALLGVVPYLVLYFALEAVFAGRATDALAWGAAAILGVCLLLLWVVRAHAMLDNFAATYALVCDMRLRLADHLGRLPMGFFTRRRTGALADVLTGDFAIYTEVVTHTWGLVIANLALPVCIAGVLFLADWRLALLAVATIPFALLAVIWSQWLLVRAGEKLMDAKADTVGRLVEYIQGIAVLRAFGRTGAKHAALAASLARLEKQSLYTELAPAPALLMYGFTVELGFTIAAVVGAWLMTGGALSPAVYLLFLVLSLRFYKSLAELGIYLAELRFASATIARIRGYFGESAQPEPAAASLPTGCDVVFDNVSFAYEEQTVLKRVWAVMRPGTLTALVGPSGSGKSTVAHLLTRLWDVDSGAIRIGGVDVRAMAMAALQAHIGIVFQDVYLFRDSVLNNIRLGCPDADAEQVLAAAKAARAHDFIVQLPQGYETILGEGGYDLSGGQRQRLSIARALLKDAPILILDEATASVDLDNERLIQQAIAALTRGRTVIVIAHRLWTIQHADQILYFEHGRIVERGTHAELLAVENGRYRRQWQAQQQAGGWRIGGATGVRSVG